MVATNQKSIMFTHIKMREESKCNTNNSHQISREENKRREEQRRTTKTTLKQ